MVTELGSKLWVALLTLFRRLSLSLHNRESGAEPEQAGWAWATLALVERNTGMGGVSRDGRTG